MGRGSVTAVCTEKADLVGRNECFIQAAVAYVARLGGATVRLRPSSDSLRNAVFLPLTTTAGITGYGVPTRHATHTGPA